MEVRKDVVAYLVIAICMAVAVGVGGFAAGKGSAQVEAAYDRGWEAGEQAALNAANARYAKGGPVREAIERNAYARGEAAGRRAGRRAGWAAGRREGIRKGEQIAFAGFPDGWQVGRWYAVRIGEGEGARGYSIPARVRLDARRAFRLCTRGVCATPLGAAASERR